MQIYILTLKLILKLHPTKKCLEVHINTSVQKFLCNEEAFPLREYNNTAVLVNV